MKMILIALGVTVLLIVGIAFFLEGKSGDEDANYAEVLGVQVNPENYELGDVPIDGGLVSKEYQVENTSDGTIKLKKIVTSCMCTEAKASIGDKETRYFGMEHPGDRNPSVNLEVPAGETMKIAVNFDPAAHGPQGTGPFDRVVTLTFSDPAGVKELTFNGTVVSK